jgi:hypothetical protein
MATMKKKGPRYVTEPQPATPLPNVSDATAKDLEGLAVQHGSFEDYQQALRAHAETVWANTESDPVALDGLDDRTASDLHNLRRQHGYTTFMQEIDRLAARVWHNAKNRGHAPAGHHESPTQEPIKKYPHAG